MESMLECKVFKKWDKEFLDKYKKVTNPPRGYHNILEFHSVREAIAGKLMAFYWIQIAYSLSNMLSKH